MIKMIINKSNKNKPNKPKMILIM